VEALEQQGGKEKLLIRHNMRCVSCGSCSHACPYGTIYPENVPYIVHNCDFCLDRRERKGEPLCIKSCPHGALKLVNSQEQLPERTYLVGRNLVVHSTHWEREKA
jgi:Fe-S-cluster-containing dehydrogenase component